MSDLSKRHPASISLMATLLIPAIALSFLACFAYARRCLEEYTACRLLKSAANLSLAGYSRKLWQEYGLLAIREEDLDYEPAETEMAKLSACVSAEISADLAEPLFGGDQLERQIVVYMKARAPVLLADDILARMRSASEARQGFTAASAGACLRERHARTEAQRNYWEGKEQIEQWDPAALPAGEEAATEEASEKAAAAEQELAALAPFLKRFSKIMLPVYEAAGNLDVTVDHAYQPSGLEQLATFLDTMLDASYASGWRNFCLTQYAINFFPAHINIERMGLGQGHVSLYTPDGRDLSHLAEITPHALECIVTGLDHPQPAFNRTKNLITGMRFVGRYLANQKDPQKQQSYLAWSQFLATAMLVLSLGEVEIAPESLKYFIQAADSLRDALRDVDLLVKGHGLTFWPVESFSFLPENYRYYRFYYRDYLRLIMLSQPAKRLANRIEKQIRKAYPDAYYTQVTVTSHIHDRVLSYATDYQTIS